MSDRSIESNNDLSLTVKVVHSSLIDSGHCENSIEFVNSLSPVNSMSNQVKRNQKIFVESIFQCQKRFLLMKKKKRRSLCIYTNDQQIKRTEEKKNSDNVARSSQCRSGSLKFNFDNDKLFEFQRCRSD